MLALEVLTGSLPLQASASADHHRSVAKRLISSSGSIKRIFFSRGARNTHHQITATPSSMPLSSNAQQHHSNFPLPPANVLDDRTPKGTGSDVPGLDAQLGNGTPPDPSLSLGRPALSIGSRHQAHADAVTEVSARYKRLRSCQRTPSEKGKIPVVGYPDLDSSDEEVMANESEDDNYSEVFTDADSGSYNSPGSPKSASHDW